MFNKYKILLRICTITLVFTSIIHSENIKYGQSGFQFMSVTSDAKAAAMGESVTAIDMNSSSVFFNPACLANMNKIIDITLSQNSWIAGITHNNISFSFNPFDGKFGTIGISYRGIDYGDDIQGAAVSANDPRGYILTDMLVPTANSMGISYAKRLTDRFAVGGQFKQVIQDFGDMKITANTTTDSTTIVNYCGNPFALDFGTIFKTNIESLQFGMSVRNFSQEVQYENEGFQLPLVFTMGISADVVDFTKFSDIHSLVVNIDASHYRARPEQLKIGIEYTLMNMLSLRTGYISNSQEYNFTFGVGVSKLGFSFDYAFIPFDSFDSVQMMTLRFNI